MAEIQLTVEGEGAIAATKALLAIPDIQGSYKPAGETDREIVLATIVTILAAAKSGIDVAAKIHEWYQRSKQGSGAQKIDKALLIGSRGQRILLEGATVEQIRNILKE
jgi:hypothetical protein